MSVWGYVSVRFFYFIILCLKTDKWKNCNYTLFCVNKLLIENVTSDVMHYVQNKNIIFQYMLMITLTLL